MENKDLTAIDWYYQKTVIEGRTNYYELFEQAKKMFENQIIKAACYDPFLGDLPIKEGLNYYQKNYS